MSSTSGNFFGNDSAFDLLAATNLVGSSRVVEVAYSSPLGGYVGNFWSSAVLVLSLGSGSRIVEVPYTSALAN
jgi:hypothetical protein